MGETRWPHNDCRSALRVVLDVARGEDLGFTPPARRPVRLRPSAEFGGVGVTSRLELLRQDLDDVIATGVGSQTLTVPGLP